MEHYHVLFFVLALGIWIHLGWILVRAILRYHESREVDRLYQEYLDHQSMVEGRDP